MDRPMALTALGALQFAAFGAGCIVLLGERSGDGELTAGDVVLAVAVAILGAVIVGSTWNGGRVGYWFQVLVGLAAVAWGAASIVAEKGVGIAAGAVGVLWMAMLALPQSRVWFLRDLE